jgi:hypothetical protein
VGFEPGASTPDAKTIRLLRAKLTETGALDRLFDAFDRRLRTNGYLAMAFDRLRISKKLIQYLFVNCHNDGLLHSILYRLTHKITDSPGRRSSLHCVMMG